MPRSRSSARRTARIRPHGVISVHPSGYGFVRTSEGEFFVPASKMGGAMGGDVVEVAPLPAASKSKGGAAARAAGSSSRPAARVTCVMERAFETLVGRYEVAEPFGVVVPLDASVPYDIFTLRADNPDVADGAIVRVRIAQYPSRNTAATGFIEEVLEGAEGMDAGIDSIISRHKFETAFSAAALEEARAAEVDVLGALSAGYRDLRERFTFTIDPVDARDFDDALSIERASGIPEGAFRLGEGAPSWRIGVHIADVSHYVKWASSLDLDARRRATSVYLVDRVIPMLPEELSCGLCSLAPGEDRRAMTVDLHVASGGVLVAYEIYPSVIRSDARLTYDEALGLLAEEGLESASADLPCRLQTLSRIARVRAKTRMQAGGMEFSSAEAKVSLDDDGRPCGVEVRRKTEATALVEEMMIWANEVVAAHLAAAEFPCAYRVHEAPSPESLAALVPVFADFPWFDAIDVTAFSLGRPRALQQALAASAERPEGELVSQLLLRAMKRADYRPENIGHYGLASTAYAHFTSPIRRYPDLVVHRMLKAQLGRKPQLFDQEVSNLTWICEHSSAMEREADDAARESQEVKLVEYLRQFVGQSFPAVVSGVASHGIYARLENTAEGFLPVRELGSEYFSFDAARHELVGEDTASVYHLGKRIAVVLVAADPRTAALEFRLAGRR